MAIFKKIIFGLNVVGPQGVNAINDFVIGETTDGKTAILVGDQIIKTGGLEYVDDEGIVHEVPFLPSLPTNTTKYYKLVEHNKTLSWAETTGLDIPALPADISEKTYSLETTSSGMAWVEKSSDGGTPIPVSFRGFSGNSDEDFRVKVNNSVIINDADSYQEGELASSWVTVLLNAGDVISFEKVGDDAYCSACTRTEVLANGRLNNEEDETFFTSPYTVANGTRSLSFDITMDK